MRLILSTIIACAGCHTPNVPLIAKHALLHQGYHRLALGAKTLRCFPAPGLEFTASTPTEERVSGVVCCGASEGTVIVDGIQHP